MYSKHMPHVHDLIDFTASAYILHPSEPKILLLKHKKIGKWLQPGGHIELDENPLQALHHELEEETGLKPSDYEIIAQPDQPHPTGGTNRPIPLPFYLNEHDINKTHKHIDIAYLLRAKTKVLTDNPDGADDIRWCSLKDLDKMQFDDEIFKDTLYICDWIVKRHYK